METVTTFKSKDFIEGINRRDQKIWNQFYKEEFPKYCSWIKHIVKDIDVAQDIVQDYFSVFYHSSLTFPTRTEFYSYTYTSLRNKAIDYYKERIHIDSMKEKWMRSCLENEEQLIEDAIRIEAENSFYNALEENLSSQQYQIILMKLKKQSYLEIAQILDVSVSSVDTQIRRACIKLRSCLKKEDYEVLLLLLFRTNLNFKNN